MSETEQSSEEISGFDAVFNRLDVWRHLPAYQLERRADIFFSFYLKEVLEGFLEKYQSTTVALANIIIPEFPLAHSALGIGRKTKENGNSYSNSVKVDYVLFSRDLSKAYFVELKTADSSTRPKQVDYLMLAKEKKEGFSAFLEGIVDLFRDTKQYEKYFHLLSMLQSLGLLDLPDDIEAKIYGDKRRRQGLTKYIESIKPVSTVCNEIEVIYLKPNVEEKDEFPTIDFDFFADYVEKHNDSMSKRFTQSLRQWKGTVAGSN